MRISSFIFVLLASCFFGAAAQPLPAPIPPASELVAVVDIASQTMTVSVDGFPVDEPWLVSTGRVGMRTPTGTFHPTSPQTPQYERYRSHKLYCSRRHGKRHCFHAPMHFAVFFDGTDDGHGGHAIHATSGNEDAGLGTRRSHGCVRISLVHATTFFRLVQQYGRNHTKIIIQ